MGYASKYYDPVKAHEYYEAHKKLKGRRTSTKGMSESQKEMAAYVKDRLDAEKQRALKSASAKSKSAEKMEKAQFTAECNAKVELLRERLKSMTKKQRINAKYLIQMKIDSLKGELDKRKKQVSGRYSAQLKSEKSAIREDYSRKYESALDDIRNR